MSIRQIRDECVSNQGQTYLIALALGASLVIAAIVSGCTVKIEPLKTKPAKTYHRSHPASSKPSSPPETIVTATWMKDYYEQEKKHGNLRIESDEKIKPVGEKFSVPREVVHHYHDMIKVPVHP